MTNMSIDDEQIIIDNKLAFVRELQELTRKYGVAVKGCGCCGSPSLEPLEPWENTLEFYYSLDTKGPQELLWCQLGSDYALIDGEIKHYLILENSINETTTYSICFLLLRVRQGRVLRRHRKNLFRLLERV